VSRAKTWPTSASVHRDVATTSASTMSRRISSAPAAEAVSTAPAMRIAGPGVGVKAKSGKKA
jgi:hypothetical protein